MKKVTKTKNQESMAMWAMDLYTQSMHSDKTYSDKDTEIYYRPFVYGSQPRLWWWGNRFGIGKALLANKWFRLIFK
jgi:hypothetical protein